MITNFVHVTGNKLINRPSKNKGGGSGVVGSTAAFHARVRGLFPGLGGLEETKMFLLHPLVQLSIVGSLRDRDVACSASDIQGLCLEDSVISLISLIWAQFRLYWHKSGLKPDLFHFIRKKNCPCKIFLSIAIMDFYNSSVLK